MSGLWLTFEGIGGSGKSTQIAKINEWMVQLGYSVVLTKEPGGTEVGIELGKIVKEQRQVKLESFTELMLFEADRQETFKKVVSPCIRIGKIVLSDRGIDGSVAYQGYGRGLPIELIDQLTEIATEGRKPDLTLLIDISKETHAERVKQRNSECEDQFDVEELSFQERVRMGFLSCARREPNRIKIVNGEQSETMVTKELVRTIGNFMDKRA